MAATGTDAPGLVMSGLRDSTETDTLISPSNQTPSPSVGEYGLFLYLPFLITVTFTFPTTADDPFITLRYAANLVHGYGFAFNSGQHVQGFTSPLHLFVAALAYLVPGGHDLFKLKIASLIFGALAIREGGKLIASIVPQVWLRRVGFVALGSSITLAFASTNALETSLVVWLLVALIRRLVVSGEENRASLPILAFLLVLARFDSLVPMAALAISGIVIERQQPWWRRSSWFLGALGAALITVASAYALFGFPLPNTYYAKAMTLTQAIPMGFTYLQNSLVPALDGSGRQGLIAAVVIITELILFLLGIVAVRKHSLRCGYLLAAVAGQLLFILKTGGDWMVGGRFFAPVMAPLIVLELLGLVEGMSMLADRRIVRASGVAGACILMAASFLPLTDLSTPIWRMSGVSDRAVISSGSYSYLSPVWSRLPSTLACLKRGQSVATTEIGYLGFSRQDLRIVDLRGLTESAIAHEAPPTMKGSGGVLDKDWINPGSPVGRDILKTQPTVIATIDWDGALPAPVIGKRYLDGKYRFANSVQAGFNVVWLFVRTGETANCVSHDTAARSSVGVQELRASVQRTLTDESLDAVLVTQSDPPLHVEHLNLGQPDRTAIPSQAASLLYQGTPLFWEGRYRVVASMYEVPPFLQTTVGASKALISVTARVSYGHLRQMTISIVKGGHVVTAELSFDPADRIAPIPAHTH